jgi:hypothetical protein
MVQLFTSADQVIVLTYSFAVGLLAGGLVLQQLYKFLQLTAVEI